MKNKLLSTAHIVTGFILVAFLLSCDTVMPKKTPGEKLFRKHCASCHGINAEGHTPRGMGKEHANLTNNDWQHGGDPYSWQDVIESELVTEHPSYDKLTTAEIRQIVDHLLYLRGETR